MFISLIIFPEHRNELSSNYWFLVKIIQRLSFFCNLFQIANYWICKNYYLILISLLFSIRNLCENYWTYGTSMGWLIYTCHASSVCLRSSAGSSSATTSSILRLLLCFIMSSITVIGLFSRAVALQWWKSLNQESNGAHCSPEQGS